MTKMLYRPQTEDKKSDGNIIHKLAFTGIPCDAIIVEQESAQEYLGKGWFAHPNDMLKPEPTTDEKEQALRDKLADLGVEVDGRWGLSTLQEKLSEAEGDNGSNAS